MTLARIIVENLSTPAAAATETLRKTVALDGYLRLPVDPYAVAQHLGLKPQKLALEPNIDGLLVKDKQGEPFKAVTDMFASEHRQRFTIAHEIGHWVHKYQNIPDDKVLGRVESRDDTSSKGIDPEEIWANRFAAALLMPAAIVRRHWGEGRTREELAEMFGVSRRSMDVRIATLGLQ
ncbi:ImmA/IrrE family metallo-endopeptidase [Bifidobacterium tsurumiense]|uniref:ImmA/IrrE family metallo-endopeptidase n=1 Tax=Bifidobacterium tsurumiense TaxID=356829 RepID=UPI0012B29F8C|nr:ImmA/IrrE family metallo-endopeptidase [Bifidobacterium tsurumiense]MDY4678246.1 ImmA/IrrE family metallo-endopeptidase [Bifidobacterium tsurumiense]MSS12152.1 ImmA/IrrE family metallo-endopeptidase [Bifidobacterium tsurumiense]